MENRVEDSGAPDPRKDQTPAETVGGFEGRPKPIDCLYQEHARLAQALESLSRSTFGDVELFVATLAVIASPAFARSGLFAEDLSDTVLLIALLSVLLGSGAVALRNLLKISVMRFYLWELSSIDEQIRIELGNPEADVFRGAERWAEWERQHFAPIALRVNILLGALLVVLPVVILVAIGSAWHVGVYAGAMCLVLAAYLTAARRLARSATVDEDRTTE
jgi:hypothetical protein